ncbi:MAG: M42 family peptidase [Oscillospiraceae bacterium]|nr:M42 family peptidase [Oscillospiraceae bacterium]
MDIKEFIIKMNAVPHVSGYEGALIEVISEAFSPYADVSVDKFGNLIARSATRRYGSDGGEGRAGRAGGSGGDGGGSHASRVGRAGGSGGDVAGPALKVMLCAHMDEIGMMVSAICENGFVKFTQVGGIDARNILAQEVTIHGREKVYGVIGIKPPHVTSPAEANKAAALHDLSIDTGYGEEKLRTLIKVGDIITINQDVAELQNSRIAGKALDDSAGVAVLYQVMKNLEFFDSCADIYYVASAQEEVGLRGATTAAYTIKPDIGIAIDVEFGRGGGGGSSGSDYETIELGKGPGLTVGPNINRKLFEVLKRAAVDNNTPYQVIVSPQGTGTDATAIQISGAGVATGLVSVPLKYMHSTVEMLVLGDIKNCGKLISDYIATLNDRDSNGGGDCGCGGGCGGDGRGDAL